MENNKNIDPIQHEKLKLHIKYIVAIALILLFGGIVLATSNQNEFVNQISFASTITSIILSVIAIWMSISGERSTNDIRMSIAESTERLSGTTKEIESLNSNYKETMDKQLIQLTNVQEQLTNIIHSVDNVGEQVARMQEKNTIVSDSINNNTITTSQRIAIFNNAYAWATYKQPYLEWLFCKIMVFNITCIKNSTLLTLNEIFLHLAQAGVNTNFYTGFINTVWGVFNTLISASVFYDENALSAILEIVNAKIIIPITPAN